MVILTCISLIAKYVENLGGGGLICNLYAFFRERNVYVPFFFKWGIWAQSENISILGFKQGGRSKAEKP